MADIGHNSGAANVAADHLLSIIKRAEKLEEGRKEIGEDLKDLYKEAAGNGFEVAALKAIVRARRETAEQKAKREQREAQEDMYRAALGIL